MMLVHSTTAVVLIYTVSGIAWGRYAAVEATALQHWTDSRQHGRVFGTQRALIVTAIPVGGAAGSLALGHASVSLILVVSAAACTLTGLLAGPGHPHPRSAPRPWTTRTGSDCLNQAASRRATASLNRRRAALVRRVQARPARRWSRSPP
jgi:hypothetical protein